MTEVKSLNVTADTYRHRGWMWRDRGTYETFKAHMKLPLWIDRILADSGGENLFVVGKEDGQRNTIKVGSFRDGVRRIPALFEAHRAQYDCRNVAGNGFRVLAERIRAKKPDTNKTPRPQWRQPMTKPWEPTVLGNNWILDSKFVESVGLNTPPPPAWADRLWVSTSANTDTFVWVNSMSKGGTAYGGELHAAKHAVGIQGYQTLGGFEPDSVVCNSGCHWQLAGVRKKTVWVPEPEVVKPVPGGHVPADDVREANRLMDLPRVETGRVSAANPLLAAPYGTLGQDVYQRLANSLGISREAAKIRMFGSAFLPQRGSKSILFDAANLERLMLAYCVRDVLGTPKPPIGVKPRNLHDEERANALDEAMVRYLNEDLPFPIEWAVEWNELRARLNKEQK